MRRIAAVPSLFPSSSALLRAFSLAILAAAPLRATDLLLSTLSAGGSSDSTLLVQSSVGQTAVSDSSASPFLGIGIIHAFQPSSGAAAPLALALRPFRTAAGPDPSFRLGEVFSFPNPARGGRRPTLHVEVGLADIVGLALYDAAGDLIQRAELFGPPRVIDAGAGPAYAYEYEVEADLASGVYICVVSARKQSEGTLEKTIRLAVIR